MNERDTIFLLEDNSLLLEQLQEALERNEYINKVQAIVFPCASIELAITVYEEIEDRIACLVCDSNMSSVGLSENFRNISEGGLFSGWLWMIEKIKADESLADRSIVYSAYYDELQAIIRQTSLFRRVPCIRKKTITSWENEEIIKEIVRILKAQKGRLKCLQKEMTEKPMKENKKTR